MAVNCFGSGVAGLSIHASMHTPPIFDSWMERKNDYHTHTRIFFFSPWDAEHPHTKISRPPCCLFTHRQKGSCFSSRRTSIVVHSSQGRIVPHAQDFSWFSSWCSELRAVLFHPRLAVKGHSHFWLSHRLLIARTDYLGHFSLLWVVLTNKLQDYCFPHAMNRVVYMPWGCCRLLNSFSLFKLWQLD